MWAFPRRGSVGRILATSIPGAPPPSSEGPEPHPLGRLEAEALSPQGLVGRAEASGVNRGEGPQEAVAGHGACSPLPSLLGGPEGPWRPTRKLPWPDTGREAPVLEFKGGNQQAPPHPAASPLGRGGLPGVDPVPWSPSPRPRRLPRADREASPVSDGIFIHPFFVRRRASWARLCPPK